MIYCTRTCSILYKNYIEIREEMDQPGQRVLNISEKVWRVEWGRKF
jgi:hypothetical protein